MKNFKVYLLRDKQNNIVYVGLTRNTLSNRFDQHMWKKKLNRNEYKIELVLDNLTNEEAVLLEKELIIQYDTINNGMNKAFGDANGNSRYHTEETKLKLSKIFKDKPVSEEHANKNRVARIGKQNSEQHKQSISDKVSIKVICLDTGKIYKSAREAAKDLNVHYTKICLVCQGKRKHTGGYHFRYYNE